MKILAQLCDLIGIVFTLQQDIINRKMSLQTTVYR